MSKTITKVIAGLGIIGGIGVAALPLTSYAVNPQDAIVQFKVNPTLSGNEAICGEESVNQGGVSPTTLDGGVITAGENKEVTCAVRYYSNAGANITLKDKDTNTDLVGNNAANTIATFAGNSGATTLPTSTSAENWGFRFSVDSPGATSGGLTLVAPYGNYNGIPTTATVIGSSTSPITDTDGAQGTITFGVATALTTAADTYRDTVTIEVTAQP